MDVKEVGKRGHRITNGGGGESVCFVSMCMCICMCVGGLIIDTICYHRKLPGKI